jgi:hypothetical protein
VTDVDISGTPPDPGPIGIDVCQLAAPIPVAEASTCVLGGPDGFDVTPGGAEHDFSAEGQGFRQGVAPEVYFKPPIPEVLGYDDAPYRFVLVFDQDTGVRLDGTAHAANVTIDLAGLNLSMPVPIDCSDLFPGGVSSSGGSPTASETKLVAFVIATFAADGSSTGSCDEIPKQVLPFLLDGASDSSFTYATS